MLLIIILNFMVSNAQQPIPNTCANFAKQDATRSCPSLFKSLPQSAQKPSCDGFESSTAKSCKNLAVQNANRGLQCASGTNSTKYHYECKAPWQAVKAYCPVEWECAGYYCVSAVRSGPDVVEAVSDIVTQSFPTDHGFLRRIGYVESRDGTHPNTYRAGYYGGIWQVDKIGFQDTQYSKSHSSLLKKFEQIKSEMGIDWTKMTWSQDGVQAPMMSALAARLLLWLKPGSIPEGTASQGSYWKKWYNTAAGAGSESKFVNDVNNMLQLRAGKVQQKLDCAVDPIVKLGEEGNCEFYKEFSAAKGCEEDDYLMGYGYKYCRRFAETEKKFTAEGKKWINCVRRKLTNFLVPFYKQIYEEESDTCAEIKDKAFGSHSDIYIECGFCNICIDNKAALWDTYYLMDFLKSPVLSFEQILDTADQCPRYGVNCMWENIKSEANDILKTVKSLSNQLIKSNPVSDAEKVTARACKWLGETFGWYCDDPMTRSVWKSLNWVRGVKDCNSFCQHLGKKEGKCVEKKNYDTSSWCPAGQTCLCK